MNNIEFIINQAVEITYSGEKERFDKWNVLINGQHFNYSTGLGLRENNKPITPKAVDVVNSILLDSEAERMNFYDFCSEFGYEIDSIKAFNTYTACLDNAKKIRKAFGSDFPQVAEYVRALEL